ncbi:5-oxoprolinase subunit PxpB [bacterium]|nr:5-oxoprolinase subunit PxpB [bacterium]
METYFIGDSCVCWSFGDEISQEISDQVLTVYRLLKSRMKDLNILDLVPAYNTLAVHFDPVIASIDFLVHEITSVIASQLLKPANGRSVAPGSKKIVIPVVYSGEDLERIASHNNLSVEQVISFHVGGRYSVAMVGFQPHFPYLIGLDKRLETPRLDSPRTKISAGSVGIGGAQTGIYPRDSPGGWNLLGITDPNLLEAIEPGDIIEFKEVETL